MTRYSVSLPPAFKREAEQLARKQGFLESIYPVVCGGESWRVGAGVTTPIFPVSPTGVVPCASRLLCCAAPAFACRRLRLRPTNGVCHLRRSRMNTIFQKRRLKKRRLFMKPTASKLTPPSKPKKRSLQNDPAPPASGCGCLSIKALHKALRERGHNVDSHPYCLDASGCR